jgi:hypothetical protein
VGVAGAGVEVYGKAISTVGVVIVASSCATRVAISESLTVSSSPLGGNAPQAVSTRLNTMNSGISFFILFSFWAAIV